MRKLIISVFAIFGLSLTTSVSANDILVYPSQDIVGKEALLTLHYSVECDNPQSAALHAVQGSVSSHGHTVRFDLFDSTNKTELLLGHIPNDNPLILRIRSSSHCRLLQLTHDLVPIPQIPTTEMSDAELALIHAPFLNSRDDQYSNLSTDLPLLLTYNVERTNSGNKLLKYTMIFSDEDSKSSASDTESQMARYGRRTDIEWIYKVEFNQNMQVISRMYQGGFSIRNAAPDIGHSYQGFAGELLPGTQHPILYNSASNNVFSHEGSFRQNLLWGHHLVPRVKISHPLAREYAMLSNPWTYKVSDQEMVRENKLTHLSSEYLFAIITGRMTRALGSSIQGRLTENVSGTATLSGNTLGNVDRLGEDMWWRQAYTGIPMGSTALEQLARRALPSTFDMISSGMRDPDLTIEDLDFFRLIDRGTTYEVEYITPHSCVLNALSSRCEFN